MSGDPESGLGRPARGRLGDQLYGQILERIASGALPEGARLPSENQICRDFGVSRPTVREALMRLQADGLVTTRPGSGTFVRRRPPEGLTRLARVTDVPGLLRALEVRIGLEAQGAALAARRRTPEDLRALREALAALRASMAAGEVAAPADYAFHCAVAAASGNDLFLALLEALAGPIRATMSVALGLTRAGSRERALRVVEEHAAILEAIEAQDPEAASLAMAHHLHRARRRVTDGQRDA